MAMVGADVEQLRQLAKTLAQGADRLDTASRTVSGQLSAVPWRGQDGDRYRSQWQSESMPMLRTAVAGLRQAADLVQRNAAEQEQASGAGGGATGFSGGGGGGGGGGGWSPHGVSGEQVVGVLGGLLAAGGLANSSANFLGGGFRGLTGAVLDGAGVAASLTGFAEGIFTDDDSKTTEGGLGLVGAAVGRRVPILGIAADAALLYASATLPTSNADIDSTFAKGAERMFGKSPDDLDHVEAAALARRYEGVWPGVANMISDSMESKADQAGKFIAGLFGR